MHWAKNQVVYCICTDLWFIALRKKAQTDSMISHISLVLWITALSYCHTNQLKTASNYHFITPELVDEDGNFLSYDVSHSLLGSRNKRSEAGKAKFESQIHYKITVQDKTYFLHLISNFHTFSKNYTLEVWNRFAIVEQRNYTPACHYIGTVSGVHKNTFSQIILSNCFGLHGVLSIGDAEYIIEPMWNQSGNGAKGHSHIIYKRSPIQLSSRHCKTINFTNELNHNKIPSMKHFQIKNYNSKLTKTKRSINFEGYLETLVVADKTMVNYHGIREVEPYILNIMNIVNQLYKEASIGHSINIVVTRIILLLEDQPDLQITQHASHTLHSFCRWQKNINPTASETNQQQTEIAHHDNAILITRHDICFNKDEPCDTLGLAHIAGICQPDRSCSINEDIGLVSGYTIAHELGHNFGMQHDGVENKCMRKSNSDRGFLMSKKLSYLSQPVRWSSCSRSYITEFIDSGLAECMRNVPYLHDFSALPVNLENLEVNQQCKSQFGSYSVPCWNKTNVCQKLWCKNRNGQCVTANIPVLNGTPCSNSKITKGWCFHGHCIAYGSRPIKVDGQWTKWSEWSQCSRSCGGGIAIRERFCANPEPENGGKFCFGERKQYKSCNISRCKMNSTDFRTLQCSAYDHQQFRGHFYTWIPYYEDHMNPCTLYCQASGYNFFIRKAAKVVDGTRCFPHSVNVCVNGQCQPVGCDNKLYSKATEDNCGVCNGNGSTCVTHNGTISLNNSLNSFHDVLHIPKHAMHILIKETESSKNILAMKSVDGLWMVSLKPSNEIAGTIFNLINYQNKSKSFYALGPTKEQIILTILIKEVDKGIYYQFNIQKHQSEKSKTVINEGCRDINKENYCQTALKLKFCTRAYFRKLCCKTCSKHINNT